MNGVWLFAASPVAVLHGSAVLHGAVPPAMFRAPGGSRLDLRSLVSTRTRKSYKLE